MSNGETALILAARDTNHRPDIVRLLLQHSASVNAKDKVCSMSAVVCKSVTIPMQMGRTALFEAVRAGALEDVKILLQNNAQMVISVKPPSALAALHDEDCSTTTLLHLAARHKQPDIVAELLQHRADPDSMGDRGRDTALHVACEVGCCVTVALLCEYHADLNRLNDVRVSICVVSMTFNYLHTTEKRICIVHCCCTRTRGYCATVAR
jgi:ankyrin repeat protein